MSSSGPEYGRVHDFLIREAELIDDRRFDDWNRLFTEDGMYWVPLDADKDPARQWSLVYDNALRREERVYHISEVPFASQQPASRTLHVLGNIRITSDHRTGDGPGDGAGDGPGSGPAGGTGNRLSVRSNQIIYEIRVGDFRQVGLGEQRSFAARVDFDLVGHGDDFRIARKTVHLINRGTPIGNLTFIL